MEFSSLLFLFLFFPVFIFLFFILKQEARNSFLLISSLLFYAWGEGEYSLLLLVSIVVNYLLGLMVQRGSSKNIKKILFIVALLFNLGLLIYYKYTLFILNNLNIESPAGGIHLPLGISFFTFQAISFITDIYRETKAMDLNPVNFGLYMALFPKLITGPITPYHNLSKQIDNQSRINPEDVSEGVKRLIIGLGKKILIADTLSQAVNHIFAVPSAHQTTSLAWVGIICYTLQIYFDFSGYTDMAIGIGRIVGFKFVENFNYPYIATSVKDFWKRWHISLALWLRDYLFLPIAYAVSRRIKQKYLMGVKAENWAYFTGAFITFLLCGIWHGANWTFFIWGGYYGVLLSLEHGWYGKKMKRRWPQGLQIFYCQLLVIIGWVFFRSDTLTYAFQYLKAMAGFGSGDGVRYYAALYLNTEIIFFLVIGLLAATPLPVTFIKKLKEKIPVKHFYNILQNLYLVVILWLCTMTMAAGTYNPFIYFRF